MPRTTTGIDVGSRSAQFMRGFFKGGTFHVKGFASRSHRASSSAEAWESLDLPFKPLNARVGLTGREVNIRYTQVPLVPDWQLRKLMRFEVEETSDQSGSEVASDFNLLPSLPEIEDEDVVLLAMARETHLAEQLEGLAEVGGKLDAFTPCSIALYQTWLRFGAIQDETVLIANIGHENLDVILVRGPDLLFARNLSGGSKLFDDAIADRFGVDQHQAEDIKIRMATLEPGAKYRDANQEKASRAILGAAGQILSLLQSTVMFCKSQVKVANLRVDRALLCGGGAALEGLPRYLSNGLSVPVEHFDPFVVVETGGLDETSSRQLEENRLESVVALGLATMGSDPEAYSVEILPAKVRKAREFLGGPAYLIASAALLALFLGFHAWNTTQRLGTIAKEVSDAERLLNRATTTDRNTSELLEENAGQAALADELYTLAGSGEQIARALVSLHESLPPEFWLTHLESDWSFDVDLGVERAEERPILRVEGRAREGTESPAVIYEGFVTSFAESLPEARVKHRPSPSGDRFAVDLTLLARARRAEGGEVEGPGDGDGDGDGGGDE